MSNDPIGAAPEARSASFLVLLFGCIAAPVFWTGQLMLGFGVSPAALRRRFSELLLAGGAGHWTGSDSCSQRTKHP